MVGAVLGLALGGVWWLAVRVWSDPVAAALVVAVDLAVTGMLHFDGLVDSADGLLAPMDRDRRLAVMADPGVGAFGLAAAGAVLLLRWAALSALRPGILLLAGLWCLSRTAMAIIVRTQPYVRGDRGLARAFQQASPAPDGRGLATRGSVERRGDPGGWLVNRVAGRTRTRQRGGGGGRRHGRSRPGSPAHPRLYR